MPLRSAKSNNTQSVRIGGEFIKGAVIPRLKYPLDDSIRLGHRVAGYSLSCGAGTRTARLEPNQDLREELRTEPASALPRR
jgi:hypothetical protein